MLDLSVSPTGSTTVAADRAESILWAVSILGPDAVIWAVADLLDLPVSEVLAELDSLVAAGTVTGGSPLALTGRGASAVARLRIPLGQRIRAHLRAAHILRDSGATAESVAGQLGQAGPAGCPWAVEILRTAAAEARERSDVQRAETYLRLALTERLDGSQRAAVMVDLARLSEPSAAIDLLLKELGRTSDPAGVLVITDAARRLMVDQDRHSAVPALLELAAGRADGMNGPATRLRLGQAAMRARTLTGVKSLASTVEWLAPRAAADPALEQPLRAARASHATLLGRDAEQALADARAVLADPASQIESCWHALFALSTAATPAELHATTLVLRNRPTTQSDPWVLDELDAFSAGALYRKGDLQAAIRMLKNLLARPEIRHNGSLQAALIPALAEVMVAAEAGSSAAELLAGRRLVDLKADQQDWPVATHAHGLVQLATDRFEASLRSFLHCGSLLTSSGIENPELIRWRWGAIRAQLGLGRQTDAAQLAEENLARATSYGAPAAVAFARFMLAVTRPTEERGVLLAQAVEGLSGAGQLLDEAQARYQYAKTLRVTGRDREADQQFLRVVSLADHCGVRSLADRARTKARSSMPAGGVPGLTPQESKIARLAADGLSNPEIAKELFLVRRTVEFHLSGVYRKLQIAGRRQLVELLGVGVRPHVWDEI